MQSSSGRDLIVGLFVIASLGAIAYLSLQVGGVSYSGRDAMQLTATFDDIGGLKPRAAVVVAGVRVGEVQHIGLADDLRALVTMQVDGSLDLSIDTEAAIRTSGVLGDQFIALEPGAEDDLLVSGGVITFTESAFNIEKLVGALVHGSEIGGQP